MLSRNPWRFVPLLALAGLASATPNVPTPVANAILASGSYQVTATCQPTVTAGDPALISGGLNLLRVDGAIPAILGVMHDDGLNGDAVAGDGIYTLVFTATSTSVTQIQLAASGAFRGLIRRLKSPAGTITVVEPTITKVSPNSATQGQQNVSVAITGEFTHFSQGATTASFGPGITVASLTVNSATSATAVLNVTPAALVGSTNVTMTTGSEAPVLTNGFTVITANLTGDVFTWHYDNTRSGVNPNETTLTTSNVASATFGKVAEFPVDAAIYGEVLYLHQVNMPSVGMKNVVYVATENDTIYAIDASTLNGSTATVLWQTSLLGSGETAVQATNNLVQCGDIFPNGVTGTPVIDRARNAIYAVAKSVDGNGNPYFRLHALSLTTGLELFGGPTTIAATYPGSAGISGNTTAAFLPGNQGQRAALLEAGNQIYIAWTGMYGDCTRTGQNQPEPYSPWVMAYSADTLAQTSVIDLAPNYSGGGIWMGGAGPAVDSAGDIYVITGNGFGGGTPATGTYANSIVKLSTSGGLAVADYFAPYNTNTENSEDLDLGSSGPMLLPDQMDSNGGTHHLTIAAGKDGQAYVINRDSMGAFNTTTNNVYQQFQLATNVNTSTPVYFNGTVYFCTVGLKAFTLANAMLPTTPTKQSTAVGSAVLSISANGAGNGIIWLEQPSAPYLWAFNAATLATLYTSSQAGSRDNFATPSRFNTPTVVDGRVYVGTASSLAVFGVLK